MRFGSESARNRRRATPRTRLGFEQLEGREVPATLAPINDFTTPNTKDLYVPLTVSSINGLVSYTATSSDPQVHADVVTGGTTLKLTVSGKDSTGADFTGDLTLRLFDDLAPVTVARIKTLVQQGFYDGLTFHRILDNFVAQGGDPNGNGTGGSGQTLPDEFNTQLTFNSPGLLAMANAGHDTGDSQFFITDTDLSLAQEPQHLNFKHTIFGQLVAGFDTFTKIMTTPVQDPSVGNPVSPVTIEHATVTDTDPNGVLRVTAPANFTGTSTITVTPTDTGGPSTGDSFNVTFVNDTVNDPPFLGPVNNVTTTPGTAVTIPLTATDLENDPLTFEVLSSTNAATGQTVNVQPSIDQVSGHVSVTPPAGFTGTINLKVGVKDASGEDTQVVQVAVGQQNTISLNQADDNGLFNNDNVTSVGTPRLTILAPTGKTVAVSVNGTSVGNATETSTPGQYQITLPAGKLKVGSNSITGSVSGSTTALTPLALTFRPSLRNVYVVPGDVGTSRQITVQLTSSETDFQNEVGFFKADDASGRIGTLSPGDAGYFAAAMARKQVLFARGTAVGTSTDITVNGGDVLVMYIVQNNTSANLLAQNPTNATTGTTVAFFGLTSANPDSFAHVAATDDPAASQVVYAWEDLTGGGDRDFNDVVVSVRPTGDALEETLRVPAQAGQTVSLVGQLETPKKAQFANSPSTGTPLTGEVGVIVTDDASGKIGTLKPGDAGYTLAALNRAQLLFANGATLGTSTTIANLTNDQFVMFYFVPGGSAAAVRTANPTNDPTKGAVAYFSIAAANPDHVTHARTFFPELATHSAPTANDPVRIHMMGKLNGTSRDFDDVVFSVTFSA
jgi:cyclophilin family peptidyl-prolyl cis-trans isomerase